MRVFALAFLLLCSLPAVASATKSGDVVSLPGAQANLLVRSWNVEEGTGCDIWTEPLDRKTGAPVISLMRISFRVPEGSHVDISVLPTKGSPNGATEQLVCSKGALVPLKK